MVKKRKHHNTKTAINKGFPSWAPKPSKITASTPYGVCGERLSAFGGLLALIKLLDLMGFEQIFEEAYRAPKRTPKLGHYRMVIGLIMLLFIGFNRLWHFVYIRLDSLVCGFFQLAILPAASTFCRYVDSLGINQANALLSVMHQLRERLWQQCGLRYERIHVSIDTTVETVYGNQQGIRKGYNPRNRGIQPPEPGEKGLPAGAGIR